MTLIAVENLHMTFPVPRRLRQLIMRPFHSERVDALFDINVRVERGERIALLGPNGAGKTTLLKIMGGLHLPTSGRVLFEGRDIADDAGELRRSVSLVMNEERSFYWRLTGRQNLEFFATLDNIGAQERATRVGHLGELVGLTPHLDKRVETYSSGMKQRLAIARGLLADPDVLILDEPTRTLDPVAAEEHVSLILERLHSDMKKTLLIATHRLDEALRLCQRAWIINGGVVRAETSLSVFHDDPRALDAFYRQAVRA